MTTGNLDTATAKKPPKNGLPTVVQEIVLIALTTLTVVSGVLTLFLHKDFGLSAHEGAYAALFSTAAIIGYSIYLAAKKHQPLDPKVLGAEILELLKEILVIVPNAVQAHEQQIEHRVMARLKAEGRLLEQEAAVDPANVRSGAISTTRTARSRTTAAKKTAAGKKGSGGDS